MSATCEIEVALQRITVKRGRKPQARGTASNPRLPRITRLMALAIKLQGMLDRGEVRDYAEIARLGFVSRARVTQLMNLLNLAPSIQELILNGEEIERVSERQLRCVGRLVQWTGQERAFTRDGRR